MKNLPRYQTIDSSEKRMYDCLTLITLERASGNFQRFYRKFLNSELLMRGSNQFNQINWNKGKILQKLCDNNFKSTFMKIGQNKFSSWILWWQNISIIILFCLIFNFNQNVYKFNQCLLNKKYLNFQYRYIQSLTYYLHVWKVFFRSK